MRSYRHGALILMAMLLPLSGCDRTAPKQSPPAQTGPIRAGTGIIRGTVSLAGKPPDMAAIPNQPCHAGAPALRDGSVVVNGDGRLQNVVIYLESPPPAPPPANFPAVSLDQVNCQFVPHVLALRTGQTLHVSSSDPTLHNVHGLCTVNDAFNFALVAAGQSKDLTFSQPERFPVRCDVHPWMKGFVEVFDHPYFAVTAKDGSFEIRNVPSGTYTLVAWHERYGELHTTVKATDGQTSNASFTFQSGQ
jgi:plastocyanin